MLLTAIHEKQAKGIAITNQNLISFPWDTKRSSVTRHEISKATESSTFIIGEYIKEQLEQRFKLISDRTVIMDFFIPHIDFIFIFMEIGDQLRHYFPTAEFKLSFESLSSNDESSSALIQICSPLSYKDSDLILENFDKEWWFHQDTAGRIHIVLE